MLVRLLLFFPFWLIMFAILSHYSHIFFTNLWTLGGITFSYPGWEGSWLNFFFPLLGKCWGEPLRWSLHKLLHKSTLYINLVAHNCYKTANFLIELLFIQCIMLQIGLISFITLFRFIPFWRIWFTRLSVRLQYVPFFSYLIHVSRNHAYWMILSHTINLTFVCYLLPLSLYFNLVWFSGVKAVPWPPSRGWKCCNWVSWQNEGSEQESSASTGWYGMLLPYSWILPKASSRCRERWQPYAINIWQIPWNIPEENR